MRLTIALSALVLASVMSVGASVAPAATSLRNNDTAVATPTLVPSCPPKLCL